MKCYDNDNSDYTDSINSNCDSCALTAVDIQQYT